MRGVFAALALAGVAAVIALGARGARPPPAAPATTVGGAPEAAVAPARPPTAPARRARRPARNAARRRAGIARLRPGADTGRAAVPVPVELRSTPAGARVTLHGRLLGHTPLSVRLPPDRTLLLVFEAQGRLSIAERVRARGGLVVTAHLPPVSVSPGLDDLKASPY